MKTFEYQKNFTEICSLGCDWQYGSIGSDNVLVPNRWQAITWTSDGLVYWCIYMRHEASMSSWDMNLNKFIYVPFSFRTPTLIFNFNLIFTVPPYEYNNVILPV